MRIDRGPEFITIFLLAFGLCVDAERWNATEDKPLFSAIHGLRDSSALHLNKTLGDLSTLFKFLPNALPKAKLVLLIDTSIPGTEGLLPEIFMSWAQVSLLTCDASEVRSYLAIPPYNRGMTQILLAVLCSPQQVTDIFEVVRKESLESSSFKWLIVAENRVPQKLPSVLREESEVVVATRVSQGLFVFQNSVVDNDDSVRFEVVGRLKVTSGDFDFFTRRPLFRDLENYVDFEGRQLKTSLVDNWPWFGLREGPNGELLPDSGIDVSIINTLSQVLNFTYQVVVPEDGLWGGPQPDGSVVGLIGVVARHEAHIAINEITITEARKTVVEFTWPYFLESSRCVSRAPKERNRAFAVFLPFSIQVWASVGISVVGISLAFFLLAKLIVRWKGQEANVFTLRDFAFNAFRNLVIQGNLIVTRQWPLRCLFGAWYLYCYYVYAVYSGTLTAVLAIPEFEVPIDSLEDIIDRTSEGFFPIVLRESSVEYIFEVSTSGIYYEIGELIKEDKNYADTTGGGVAAVLYGKGVYIEASLSTEMQAMLRGRQRFYIGRHTFFPQHYGIVCRRGSPFKQVFSRLLLRITESGLIDKWRKEQINKLSQGGGGGGGEEEEEGGGRRGGPGALTLTHLQGAFFLYVIGFAVSVLVLVGEKLLASCAK